MQNFEVLVNRFLCRSFNLCSYSGFLWNFTLAFYFFEWLLFCCLILCRSSEKYLPWSLWSILTLCRSMRYTSLSYFLLKVVSSCSDSEKMTICFSKCFYCVAICCIQSYIYTVSYMCVSWLLANVMTRVRLPIASGNMTQTHDAIIIFPLKFWADCYYIICTSHREPIKSVGRNDS
jgi:hypothetical protein